MVSKRYEVSVVIRTRDIERHLYELLDRLSSQTLQPSEIVIVDNFSTGKLLNEMIFLIRKVKRELFNGDVQMKVVPISDSEFSYAYSANIGVWASQFELVCITNGHCLPISDKWLEY